MCIRDRYQVSARVAGQVVHVDVEEEQFVHAGDPIAEVDPKDYQVALEQAEADLANAQAQYQQASVNVPITGTNVNTSVLTTSSDVLGSEASVSQAEAQAQAAKARVDSAKATALKAQIDVDRYTPLVAKDVILSLIHISAARAGCARRHRRGGFCLQGCGVRGRG